MVPMVATSTDFIPKDRRHITGLVWKEEIDYLVQSGQNRQMFS